MDAIKISLDDYTLFGGGANGESYDHKTNPSLMLKLYLPGKIQQPLDEMMMARKVYDLGIPTPEPGDYVVTEDGRYGIRFRRITGKKSYSRATGDNPQLVGQYAQEFAQMCLKLHSIHVDTTQFESVKDRYYRLLAENPFFTSYNMFDLGMVYLCCCLSKEEFIQETFHMPKSLAIEFWKNFAPAYFGQDRPLKDIEEEIRPYAGLKTLIVERDTKCPMPELRAGMASLL